MAKNQLSKYQSGIIEIMKKGYKLSNTRNPFLFKNGHNIPVKKHSIGILIAKRVLTNGIHPKLVDDDNYKNMPKWNKELYGSWQDWARACFDAGSREKVADLLKIISKEEDLHITEESLEAGTKAVNEMFKGADFEINKPQ